MGPVHILIVDDHPENLLALEAILQQSGHILIRAGSGAEALKAVLRFDFALILMDVAMPDMDGYETAELIRKRERSRHTPIIFLTANFKSDVHVFRGYLAGAVDYLFKPFVPEVLLSKVAVFVELYSKRQAIKESSEALKAAYDEMERRVEERTSQLADANRSLKKEIAERERAERERADLLLREQSARLEAQAMNRLKDEFLATLSHELRTPLNAILGWAHLLEVGKRDDEAIARATRVIKNNAQAQAQLVADILDVSRIISGKLNLHLSLVSMHEVVEAALETIQPAADAKSISIELAGDGGAPLLADRDRLQQVMWNLLSNAIKFTPKGGRVRIEMNAAADEATVVVTDSGEGIETAFLPHVFERFTQADSSFARAHGGLGLGMAIVRHLIELHGGGVAVASPGKGLGATFTVTLPLNVRTADGELPPVERRAVGRDALQPLQRLDGVDIVVLDHQVEARDVLRGMLEGCGARVTAVGDVDDAIRAVKTHAPHVVVSDTGGDQCGMALIREVRALPAGSGGTVPAIALIAEGSDLATIGAGFDRHLAKPVHPADLVEAVAALAAVKIRRK